MDRRILKTKQSIFDAFYRLIVKLPYSKISVQTIIDEANIGRSTFYEHFETKDDLLKQMCINLFEHIFSHYNYDENSYEASFESIVQGKITHILYHIKEHKKEIKGILSSEGSEIFLLHFKKYISNILKYVKLDSECVPKDFLSNHIIGSFIEAFKWWAENNFEDTPEDLGNYIIYALNIKEKC